MRKSYSYPPYVKGQATHKDLVGILDDRLKKMPAIRRNIVDEVSRIYGPDADETLAVEIGAHVASPLNRIFFDQLKQGAATPAAWKYASPEGVELLKKEIGKVLGSKQYQKFLQKNHGFHATLVELAKLTDISDRKELVKSWQRLEKTALISYEAGQPVLLSEMSQYYTDLENTSNAAYRLLEADVRVILPVEKETKKLIDTVADEQWEELKKLNRDQPHLSHRKRPPLIAGVVAISGGVQTLSLVTGEAFTGSGIYLPLNAYRTDQAYVNAKEFSGLPIPDNALNMQFLMYIGHELAHKLRWVSGKLKHMHETGPDVSMLIANLRSIMQHDPDGSRGLLRQYLSAFVTEYGVLTTDIERPYQVSSAVVLNALANAEMVTYVDSTENRLFLDLSPEKLAALLARLTGYHNAIYIEKDRRIAKELADRPLRGEMQSFVAEITAD